MGVYFWATVAYTLINVYTFGLYALDKYRARKDMWRVAERILISLAILGGSLGALIAMVSLRHKNRKPLFFLGLPFIFITQLACVYWLYQVGVI